MTPERCTGLAALLLDLRDWMNDQDPGNLDAPLVDAVIDILARVRQSLVEEGSQ